MHGLRPALAVVLVLLAAPATAKRPAPPGFAEPGDIIAAEGNFTHLSAAKGTKAAIRATAAPDAQIFTVQLIRVAAYPAPEAVPPWHTRQLWMSCDGSVAVTHGEWQQNPGVGWYIAIWKRQKGGGYKWVLAEGGASAAPLPESDMIAASVADCPVHRTRAGLAPAPAGNMPPADYRSGHADDGTLAWSTDIARDGSRTFSLQIRQDAVLHEVLRLIAPPVG